MSLTSCFKYAIEIPETSLSSLLRSILGSAEAGGLPTTYVENDIAMGEYIVSVVAALVDSNDSPPSIDITSTPLEALLHLTMRIEVTVENYEGLDPIIYNATFVVPGTFEVDAAVNPKMLQIAVGDLTGVDLQLAVTGGEIHFTPTVFENAVHQMYDDHPEFHEFWKIKSLAGQSRRVMVWVYDDAMNPITVELPTPTVLRIHLPGKLEFWTTDIPSLKEAEATFTAAIDVDILDQIGMDGVRRIILDLEHLTSTDVAVALTWVGTAPFYAPVVPTLMAGEIATFFQGFDNIERTVPGQDQIQARIREGIENFASNTDWELFPLAGGGSEFDLSTAIPVTVGGAALALEIESEPSQPCDGLDNFVTGAKLATAIGPTEAQRRLDDASDKVDQLPDQKIDGYDVSLNRPSMHLEDPGEHGVAEGHIWVDGTAVVHVGGCVGDVDATYSGSLTLTVSTASDGTVNFDVVAGEFGGDADGKKDKDNWDPDKIKTYIESLDWDFPSVPARFDGRFDLNVDFNEVSVDRRGIIVSGVLSIVTVNQAMSASVHTRSPWPHESGHGG